MSGHYEPLSSMIKKHSWWSNRQADRQVDTNRDPTATTTLWHYFFLDFFSLDIAQQRSDHKLLSRLVTHHVQQLSHPHFQPHSQQKKSQPVLLAVSNHCEWSIMVQPLNQYHKHTNHQRNWFNHGPPLNHKLPMVTDQCRCSSMFTAGLWGPLPMSRNTPPAKTGISDSMCKKIEVE